MRSKIKILEIHCRQTMIDDLKVARGSMNGRNLRNSGSGVL